MMGRRWGRPVVGLVAPALVGAAHLRSTTTLPPAARRTFAAATAALPGCAMERERGQAKRQYDWNDCFSFHSLLTFVFVRGFVHGKTPRSISHHSTPGA